MNIKKWLLGSLAIFVALTAMEYVVHVVILKTVYENTSQLWRQPEMQTTMVGWRWSGYALFALLFGFVYTHGYKGKGAVGEGMRYGLYVGLLVFLPFGLVRYTFLPHPTNLAFAGIAFGVIESLLCGLIFGLIYRDHQRD
jgi:Na+-driven multidrug efflux pump